MTMRNISIQELKNTGITRFNFDVSKDDSQKLVAALDLLSLKKPKFSGQINAVGKGSWHLKADLGATVEQTCIVTLAPVKTRIDVQVERVYAPTAQEFEADSETEMESDDRTEDIPSEINLFSLFQEELSLHLPEYPRADEASFGNVIVSPENTESLTDEAMKPFAGLQSLKDKLENSDKS